MFSRKSLSLAVVLGMTLSLTPTPAMALWEGQKDPAGAIPAFLAICLVAGGAIGATTYHYLNKRSNQAQQNQNPAQPNQAQQPAQNAPAAPNQPAPANSSLIAGIAIGMGITAVASMAYFYKVTISFVPR